MKEYKPEVIEKKWQQQWTEDGIYTVADKEEGKKNKMILVEFPYPSGDLHVGHWYAFAITDIYARYVRMLGYNVMFPIGFDAFGLPAENAAIKHKKNPADWTFANIDRMKDQVRSMGTMFDWSREVTSCTPEYYKWTQWLFLQMYAKDLATQKETPVNWCPSCKTVLANEQVVDGHCERCDSEVEERLMNQWILKITNYAERLINGLEDLEWPEEIKTSQKNWIGKSQGANFICNIKDLNIEVEMYNSVPQTFCAETFTAIAPEHPLIKTLVEGTEYEKPVLEMVEKIKKQKKTDKYYAEKSTDGIFTGRYIENFCGTGKDLPIWVASYAIYDYGTGIVNASAHDERDFAFAKANNIPLHPVMVPEDEAEAKKVLDEEYAYVRDPEAILLEPQEFKGRKWGEAREDIIDYLVENGYAKRQVNYKLRDWVVSRQRYWGCPIPIIHCEKCGPVAVPEKDLPVQLPEVDDYLPHDDGSSPLAKAEDWVNVACPECGADAKRETDTFDTFMDSSWYFLRYTDPKNTEKFAEQEKMDAWMPVDFYSGGAEHTTMHLLYSRFFQKALFDLGLVKDEEPYKRRLNRGLILGPDGNKMSKSKGNVINPDDIVEKLGSDTLRLYLAFIGPYNEVGYYPWDPNGVVGVRRFIERVWRLSQSDFIDTTPEVVEQTLHQTIQAVTDSCERLKFNTAIAKIMTMVSMAEKEGISKDNFLLIIRLLAPFVPHVSEEIHSELSDEITSVHVADWPLADKEKAKQDTISVVIQVNGKVRGSIEVSVDEDENTVISKAKEVETVSKWLEGNVVKKEVYVPGKIVNFVV